MKEGKEVMVDIPFHIISIILSFLPFISTDRFKCVSREWNELISSPEFFEKQLKNYISYGQARLLILRDGTSLISRDIDYIFNQLRKVDLPRSSYSFGPLICGSTRGLVALVFRRYNDPNKHAFYLCNPLFEGCFSPPDLELPPNNIGKGYRFVSFGFGYDSFNDDYKIVSVNLIGTLRQTIVYSSKHNSWGNPSDIVTEESECFGSNKFKPGIVINNQFVHWIYYDECLVNKKLRRFDVCSEIWTDLPLVLPWPNGKEEEDGDEFILGSFNESLCILCIRKENHEQTGVFVWVMNDYGVEGSWSISFWFMHPHFTLGKILSPPIAFSKSKQQILLVQELEQPRNGCFYSWYELQSGISLVLMQFMTFFDFILCDPTNVRVTNRCIGPVVE